MDIARAIQEIKAGKVEYRLDKTNIIHTPIGKASLVKRSWWTTSMLCWRQ